MSDSVLAALIAGTATLSASFLQLRSALLRDKGRGQSVSATRRKSRLQRIIFFVIVGGAAASGFAISQWLNEGERATQVSMQRELQARIAEVSRTSQELASMEAAQRAEIEAGVLRRIGTDGVVASATVAACHSPAAGTACTEAEAAPVTLCATIPEKASITEVALFSRPADTDTPWSANRLLPGQEAGQARFADKYSETTPENGTRQVCQGFAHWSSEHARAVRMLVRYTL